MPRFQDSKKLMPLGFLNNLIELKEVSLLLVLKSKVPNSWKYLFVAFIRVAFFAHWICIGRKFSKHACGAIERQLGVTRFPHFLHLFFRRPISA